ncbi:MAG TPA: hypothetical protein VFV81_08615 [Verrucomicrobiae bacterium]|nr:hypothetical protein [Verrucomicrobiae bacterium]
MVNRFRLKEKLAGKKSPSTVAMLIAMTGFAGLVAARPMSSPHDNRSAFPVRGMELQKMVMRRCVQIARWNRPYQFNGVGDCYGYCRQVWNAILSDGREHAEDYSPNTYDQRRWVNFPGGIPVNTCPDTNWIHFSTTNDLVPGDLLATDQGHRWGENWHGGIYAGNGENWDCSRMNGLDGAYRRPLYAGFHYYYQPLHDLLLAQSAADIAPARQINRDAAVRQNNGPATAATAAAAPSDAAARRQ